MIIDYRSFIFSIPCDSSVKTNLHNEPSIIVEKEDWSIVPLLLLLRNYIRAILSSSFPEKKKKKKEIELVRTKEKRNDSTNRSTAVSRKKSKSKGLIEKDFSYFQIGGIQSATRIQSGSLKEEAMSCCAVLSTKWSPRRRW